uniref:Uncharacterized protein n=1 Tax=viral metagenome TaxID=1070528 RepID=A0A6C0I9K7_9ZZZZ
MVKNIKDTMMFKMNWLSFAFAFVLGIFYVYISSPPIRNVIKYPTPYNANKIVYMNHDNQCYKYNAEEVKCTEASLTQPII